MSARLYLLSRFTMVFIPLPDLMYTVYRGFHNTILHILACRTICSKVSLYPLSFTIYCGFILWEYVNGIHLLVKAIQGEVIMPCISCQWSGGCICPQLVMWSGQITINTVLVHNYVYMHNVHENFVMLYGLAVVLKTVDKPCRTVWGEIIFSRSVKITKSQGIL